VTKSDLPGHVLPRLGISDWAHEGIANLFTNIDKNGYKVVYLTARPIGYSSNTKKYLASIKQDGKYTMPDGPLLLSPERLAKSIFVEVVIKQPHIFKIGCLGKIKSLFPLNPFYAGFGNRETDYKSYTSLGITDSKIFIINTKGVVKLHENKEYNKSYKFICGIVDMMFPHVKKSDESFNNLNYWKPDDKNSEDMLKEYLE
jgi:phosphatidate phosphatase LPIN